MPLRETILAEDAGLGGDARAAAGPRVEQLLLPLGQLGETPVWPFLTLDRQEVLAVLSDLGGSVGVFLHGPAAVGKTHLLQWLALARGHWNPYLDCAEVSAESLGMDDEPWCSVPLLCLDNVAAWAGDRRGEAWLYRIHNGRQAGGRPTVLAARQAPAEIPWGLPDWASRATSLLPLALKAPDEAGVLAILRQVGARQGVLWPDALLQYLLRHHSRELGSLLVLLDDFAAWLWQRRGRPSLTRLREFLASRGGA